MVTIFITALASCTVLAVFGFPVPFHITSGTSYPVLRGCIARDKQHQIYLLFLRPSRLGGFDHVEGIAGSLVRICEFHVGSGHGLGALGLHKIIKLL